MKTTLLLLPALFISSLPSFAAFAETRSIVQKNVPAVLEDLQQYVEKQNDLLRRTNLLESAKVSDLDAYVIENRLNEVHRPLPQQLEDIRARATYYQLVITDKDLAKKAETAFLRMRAHEVSQKINGLPNNPIIQKHAGSALNAAERLAALQSEYDDIIKEAYSKNVVIQKPLPDYIESLSGLTPLELQKKLSVDSSNGVRRHISGVTIRRIISDNRSAATYGIRHGVARINELRALKSEATSASSLVPRSKVRGLRGGLSVLALGSLVGAITSESTSMNSSVALSADTKAADTNIQTSVAHHKDPEAQ